MNTIVKSFIYLICYLIYPFSFLVPRNKKKMAFGSYRGLFNDNSKYLFIYAAEHGFKENICWISLNKKTVKQIQKMGLPAYWVCSPKGIFWALRAKRWFVNSYASDIMFCLSGGATIINLWHGNGVKRCEFTTTSGPLAKRYIERNFREVFFHPECFRRPDYMLSCASIQEEILAPSFRIPRSKFFRYGYPRNMILTRSKNEIMDFVQKYEPKSTLNLIQKCRLYNKVFIYMPTWRDSQLDVFIQQFDMPQLNSILTKQKALLLLKPHANTHVNDIKEFSNILFIDRKTDVYSILPFTDILITDYSSIQYDYLLIPNKNIILYLYDIEEYIKDRDFYFPFIENVAGKQATTWQQLVSIIENQDYAMNEIERKRILDKFWGNTTKLNPCEKILEVFTK